MENVKMKKKIYILKSKLKNTGKGKTNVSNSESSVYVVEEMGRGDERSEKKN